MSVEGWVPEIVIGVDFGMTCTGVAYSMGPDWPEPKTMQHWPGKMINELANKVPTLLQYNEDANTIKAWGFLCDEEDGDDVGYFKLRLDPKYQDPRPDAPSLQQARQWYQDFLRCLHDYIEESFSSSFPRWKSQKTEFIFSVPTTWKDPSMIAETERLIQAAGFGSDGLDHRAVIGLTEAEAAAVYGAKQQMEQNNVILVCDAGGGTTDVNTLKLVSSKGEAIELQQLAWVEGRPIGSALIDINFHQLVSERLNKVRAHLRDDPDFVADQMVHGRFERIKCSYGTAASSTLPTFPIEVPGLDASFTDPDTKIEDSKMIFTAEELRSLFNVQITRMIEVIDEQLDKVYENHPGLQISYLVLSGGLGSSPYVRQCLHFHYDSGPGSSKMNANGLKILSAAEPQLAVVHGLVIDRVQTISRGAAIFKERCCRISYGVLCLEEFNPGNPAHIASKMTIDPRDGKKWAEDQIDWFVKQGESILTSGIIKPYVMKINPGKEGRVWQTHVVMSTLPRERLPSSMSQGGAERLCDVEAVLQGKGVEMKRKNRHWYSRGEEYVRAKFNIKVVLGAADIKFQLESKDQKILSNDHNPITVKWEAVKQIAAESTHASMYREKRP